MLNWPPRRCAAQPGWCQSIGLSSRSVRPSANSSATHRSGVVRGAGNRLWIEVRGLGDSRCGRQLAESVLDAVRAQPGVASAQINYPLSRVIVGVDDDGPSMRTLCDVVAAAEKRARESHAEPHRDQPTELPADGVVLANSMVAATASAAGLCAAVAGRALLWPRLPAGLAAAVTVVDLQPRLRRLVEDRLGFSAADTALAVAASAVYTLTQAPGSLAVDLILHIAKAAESSAASRAWERHEPDLARHASCDDADPMTPRPRPRPPGPVERHTDRSGLAQAIAAATIGVLSHNLNAAATAAVVAAPKAARSARESFASTLGRGLADDHGVLPLRPGALRRLDRVDTVLVDPRALCTDELRVSRIRGSPKHQRAAVWEWARDRLDREKLTSGWHKVTGQSAPSGNGRKPAEVLVRNAHHLLATAVLSEVRSAGAEAVSIDVDALDDLRSMFDELRPADGATNEAMAEAVEHFQREGRTVAVVSCSAAQALSAADVAIGLKPGDGEPPWHAHLMVDDLAGVWQILHALPAARKASIRGVEIATAASLLGALLIVPGVRGRGPGPVTAGAGAGVWTGYRLAQGALRANVPPPAPTHEWHAMSVDRVSQILPRPALDDDRPARSGLAAAARSSASAVERVVGAPPRAVWQFGGALRAELSDPLTPLLAVGSAASAVLGSPIDAVLVGSVVIGNATLAAAQRLRAERLLSRLLAVQDPPARKVLDGSSVGLERSDPGNTSDDRGYESVESARLRPGEVIEVGPGEVVPADGRLIEGVGRRSRRVLADRGIAAGGQAGRRTPGVPLGERSCMVFSGTTILTGTGGRGGHRRGPPRRRRAARATPARPGSARGAAGPARVHRRGVAGQRGRWCAGPVRFAARDGSGRPSRSGVAVSGGGGSRRVCRSSRHSRSRPPHAGSQVGGTGTGAPVRRGTRPGRRRVLRQDGHPQRGPSAGHQRVHGPGVRSRGRGRGRGAGIETAGGGRARHRRRRGGR